MIEVRSPCPDELDEMLTVMCEAFNLPYGPARDVFYKDPYFDVRRKRVLVEDGRVASCLTVVDAPLWIGEAVVSVAGVAGVATRQEARRRGYATRLLQDAVPTLRDLGYGLAALFAVRPAFYRRLDWEPVSPQVEMTLPLASLPSTRDARFVRPALPTDAPFLVRLYDTWSRGQTGCRTRDEKRWRYLFENVKHRVVYKRQDVEGYALYDLREAEGRHATVRLLELVANSEDARRGLLGHLAQRAGCERLEYTARWNHIGENGFLHAAGQFCADGASAGSLVIVHGPLVRLIDLRRTLDDLQPNLDGFDGSVTVVVRERPSDRHPVECVTIESGGGSVSAREGDERENPRSRIEGDSRAWAAVIAGQLSLGDAVACGRLRATAQAAVTRLGPFFPRRDFAIPTADHF